MEGRVSVNSQRALIIVTVSLFALGFALSAQAGPRLYQGSIVIHAFANDTTNGSTTPFTMNAAQAFPPVNACAA